MVLLLAGTADAAYIPSTPVAPTPQPTFAYTPPTPVPTATLVPTATPQPHESMFLSDTSATNLSTTAIRYIVVSGSTPSVATEENVNQIVADNATAIKMTCAVDVAPGTSKHWIFILRDNAANTALTCTISDSAKTCTDNSHTASLVGGTDFIDYEADPDSTNPAAAHGHCSLVVRITS